jgi:hypothetical protein
MATHVRILLICGNIFSDFIPRRCSDFCLLNNHQLKLVG